MKLVAKKNQPGTASFHVANAKPDELRFIGSIVALFCDPARAAQAAAVKNREARLRWSNGAAIVCFEAPEK